MKEHPREMFRRKNNWAYTLFVFCLMIGIAITANAQSGKAGRESQLAKPGQPVAVKPGESVPAKPGPTEAPKTAQAAPAKPVPTQKGTDVKKDASPKFNIEDFTYSPSGTRNPFEPILLLKAKTSRGLSVKTASTKKMTEKAKADRLDYELEELRLVGVIKSGNGMIAMMEDTQGKGIFFRKGDYLNKSMWVEDVTASNMVLGYKARGEMKKITVNIPSKK